MWRGRHAMGFYIGGRRYSSLRPHAREQKHEGQVRTRPSSTRWVLSSGVLFTRSQRFREDQHNGTRGTQLFLKQPAQTSREVVFAEQFGI